MYVNACLADLPPQEASPVTQQAAGHVLCFAKRLASSTCQRPRTIGHVMSPRQFDIKAPNLQHQIQSNLGAIKQACAKKTKPAQIRPTFDASAARQTCEIKLLRQVCGERPRPFFPDSRPSCNMVEYTERCFWWAHCSTTFCCLLMPPWPPSSRTSSHCPPVALPSHFKKSKKPSPTFSTSPQKVPSPLFYCPGPLPNWVVTSTAYNPSVPFHPSQDLLGAQWFAPWMVKPLTKVSRISRLEKACSRKLSGNAEPRAIRFLVRAWAKMATDIYIYIHALYSIYILPRTQLTSCWGVDLPFLWVKSWKKNGDLGSRYMGSYLCAILKI